MEAFFAHHVLGHVGDLAATSSMRPRAISRSRFLPWWGERGSAMTAPWMSCFIPKKLDYRGQNLINRISMARKISAKMINEYHI